MTVKQKSTIGRGGNRDFHPPDRQVTPEAQCEHHENEPASNEDGQTNTSGSGGLYKSIHQGPEDRTGTDYDSEIKTDQDGPTQTTSETRSQYQSNKRADDQRSHPIPKVRISTNPTQPLR